MRHAHKIFLQKARTLPERRVHARVIAGEAHMVRVLSLVLALCVAVYVYFVGAAIMNVISNREASVESERLRSVVGTLEESYFELAHSLSPAAAGAYGLTVGVDTSYVRRAGAVATNATPAGI